MAWKNYCRSFHNVGNYSGEGHVLASFSALYVICNPRFHSLAIAFLFSLALTARSHA